MLQSFGEITVYDEMEDGSTGSDEINDKLTSMMAHRIKQQHQQNQQQHQQQQQQQQLQQPPPQDERSKSLPNYNAPLVSAHGQVLASNPVPEQYGRSAALTPAAPTQPPPPQPPPVVIQQPTRHSQSSYANQLLLQQRQSHHQSMQQHANAAHHPQPAGYTNTGNFITISTNTAISCKVSPIFNEKLSSFLTFKEKVSYSINFRQILYSVFLDAS